MNMLDALPSHLYCSVLLHATHAVKDAIFHLNLREPQVSCCCKSGWSPNVHILGCSGGWQCGSADDARADAATAAAARWPAASEGTSVLLVVRVLICISVCSNASLTSFGVCIPQPFNHVHNLLALLCLETTLSNQWNHFIS